MATLGKYELLEQLGKGAFGSVHRVKLNGPLGFSEELAVKVMNPSVAASDPDALPALADEARILSQLRHPNIVGLRGFEEVEHEGQAHHLLILEYVKGVTVEQIIRLLGHLGRPLSLSATLLLWDDTLAGLQHAHEATTPDGQPLALVHRDLKPPNLMVDEKGNVRILDFGIALARERLVRTMIGRTKGSPPWMSPEQVRGDPQDARSDLWVVSTIIFRLLTGQWWVKPPVTRDEGVLILRSLLKTDWNAQKRVFADATSRRGYLPLKRGDRRQLEALMRSLLDLEMSRRPADAGEVRSRIAGLSAWDPVQGRTILSRICRGILKGGPGGAPPVNVETRRMPKVTQLTSPGSPRPKRPTTKTIALKPQEQPVQDLPPSAIEAARRPARSTSGEFDLVVEVDNLGRVTEEFVDEDLRRRATEESVRKALFADPTNLDETAPTLEEEEFGRDPTRDSGWTRPIAPDAVPEPEALRGLIDDEEDP